VLAICSRSRVIVVVGGHGGIANEMISSRGIAAKSTNTRQGWYGEMAIRLRKDIVVDARKCVRARASSVVDTTKTDNVSRGYVVAE
jgi:hypothetical protein